MKISTFPINVSWKFPSVLQFRSFQIPWFQRNYAIACAKERSLSSSVPIRYIPKRPSTIEESHHSSTREDFSENEVENRLDSKPLRFDASQGAGNVKRSYILSESHSNQIHINNVLYNDAKPGVLHLKKHVHHDSEAMDIESEPEEFLDESEIFKGKEKDCLQDAKNMAVKLLARRAFTAVELGKKLQGKKFPRQIVEAVINDLQNRGFINDSLYAETFSCSRWSYLSWAPRRIKQELVKKGVSEDDMEKALKVVFDSEEESSSSRFGMSKLSMDHLYAQASKQWLRGRGVPLEKQKSRMIRWLQYRGFNWALISFILNKLETHNSP